MAAEKIVPAAGPMEWQPTDSGRHARWTGRIEVDGAQVGEIHLVANLYFTRGWTFKLLFHTEDVYRVDARLGPSGHSNPPADRRPEGFKGNVTCATHEHVWFEQFDDKLTCARELCEWEGLSHEEVLQEFCRRSRVRFEPDYTAPGKGIQLELS